MCLFLGNFTLFPDALGNNIRCNLSSFSCPTCAAASALFTQGFCFAMLSGRAHRRDNVQVMGNADWGARLRTRKDTTAALKALRCSALVERNCRVWHNWSNGAAVGALPQAPQGAPPLDPFWAARLGRFSILPLPQIFLSPALPLFPPPHILPLEGRGISPLQERE